MILPFLNSYPSHGPCPTLEPTKPKQRAGSYIEYFMRTPGLIPDFDGPLITQVFKLDHQSVEMNLFIGEMFYGFNSTRIFGYRGQIKNGLQEHILFVDCLCKRPELRI